MVRESLSEEVRVKDIKDMIEGTMGIRRGRAFPAERTAIARAITQVHT